LASADFIGISEPDHNLSGHHDKLLANMLGQAEALALGTDAPETPHHSCPGNRPSTVILLRRLDPFHLGMLLGLYEHKVMVEGVIWDINSFDQFGVELAKRQAGAAFDALTGKSMPANPATAGSIRQVMAWRE
jgi:glucose-6-phosphate isomerase